MNPIRAYISAVLERAIKSAAQGGLLAVGADKLDVLHADWATVGGFAGGAFVLSVMTSLASSGVGNAGPSLTSESVEPEVVEVPANVNEIPDDPA